MATLPKTYVYKVYTGSVYKGTLDNVTSDFGYRQLMNAAGAQTTITLQASFPDVNAAAVTDSLVDEAGNLIVDEDGNSILVASSYVFGNVPIDLGNRVVVTEFSDNDVNGQTVFDGIITGWSGDYLNDGVDVTVLGHGVRLDNYILDPSQDIDVEQNTYDSEYTLSASDPGRPKLAQTFQMTITTLISSIVVYCRRSGASLGRVNLDLVEGTPSVPGATLASVTVDLPSTAVEAVSFAFSTPVMLTISTTYHFVLTNYGANTSGWSVPYIEYKNSNVYSNGQMFIGTGFPTAWAAQTADMAFAVNSSGGSVSTSFSNSDPSDIIRTALALFNAKGGVVTYDSSSIDDTGVGVNYTFLLSTILETIKKGYSLAPGSWYWYVDPATNLLHFHDTNTVADHTFILGQHLENLHVSQNLDDITNIVYFSGGEVTPGVNLFRINQNSDSINTYGQWLERFSDNRVTLTATADSISLALLGKFSTPGFNTVVTIPEGVYDISSISIGQTVQFRNFNNLIDSLLLQIVAIRKTPDEIELTLGTPLPRNSKLMDIIQRRLTALETQNNPETTT